jgi:hypothetical protein
MTVLYSVQAHIHQLQSAFTAEKLPFTPFSSLDVLFDLVAFQIGQFPFEHFGSHKIQFSSLSKFVL